MLIVNDSAVVAGILSPKVTVKILPLTLTVEPEFPPTLDTPTPVKS